jgi:hypothetical protein
VTAIDVSALNTRLLDAVVRLLEAPSAVRFFLPLLKREIVYWVLSGAQREGLNVLQCHRSSGDYPALEAKAANASGVPKPPLRSSPHIMLA